MQIYKNLGGNSNIHSFEVGVDYIDVQFNAGAIYRYSYKSAGSNHIEQMKTLAEQGCGLNSYINCNVRKKYECRIR